MDTHRILYCTVGRSRNPRINSIKDNEVCDSPLFYSERTVGKKIETVEDLMSKYPQQFDKIGNFPGTYHISLDTEVQPVHYGMSHPSPRRIEVRVRQHGTEWDYQKSYRANRLGKQPCVLTEEQWCYTYLP